MRSLGLRAGAEFLGTALLVAVVIGSGIMGTNLSDDDGVTLLINAVSTVAGLAVLIWILGPVSGAHFNPVVSLVELLQHRMSLRNFFTYTGAQLVGGATGTMLANTMYALPAINISTTERTGLHLWLGEIIATAGLLLTIGVLGRNGRVGHGFALVPLWIGSAYFFTSSTSFANPAVTFGRMFSDTFAGIAPMSAPMFIGMQLVGAIVGMQLARAFTRNQE